jgi:O-antigen ligase
MLESKSKPLSSKIKFLLLASLITITPWISFDAINLPKFFILNMLGWPILIHLIYSRKLLFHKGHNKLILVSIGFLTWGLISTLLSESNVVDRLIGSNDKNMGLVTYILLTTILVASSTIQDSSQSKFLNSIVFIGVISGFYGVIQYSGYDPISWVNSSGTVFGIFGNPNFHSAFMSINILATLTLILGKNSKAYMVYALNLLISFFNLYASNSTQGYLLLVIGLTFFFIVWIHKITQSVLPTLSVLAISIFMFIILLLDILQKTPWKSLFYEQSISYRGDYWRAGWNMLLSNPLFGVGFDGFKGNYRIYRDAQSIERGISGNVDSAHNVLLDIGTSGGFLLLALYVALNSLILLSVFRIIFHHDLNNYSIIGIISCWIVYTVQSFISVPRISLSILGWILGGLIIGYDLNQSHTKLINQNFTKTKGVVIGIIIGMMISLPPLINDVRFRTVLNSGDIEAIEQALKQWPQSYEHIIFTSSLLGKAGFSKEALDFSYLALKYNSKCFECWELVATSNNSSENEKLVAIKNLQELDPNNSVLNRISLDLE